MTPVLGPQTPRGQHAIVIGGGIAGLAGARVLSDVFAKVTLLDADVFPSEVANRKAIPQGYHSHVLMANGRLIFERFFPGLDDALEASGVSLVDWGNDCLIYSSAGLVPRFPSRLLTRPCTRPQLEFVVRERVRALPNVQLRTGARVEGLLGAQDRVTGVQLEGVAEPLLADFVLDASGRHSDTPRWLRRSATGSPRNRW